MRHPDGDKIIIARYEGTNHWVYFSVRNDRDNGTVVDFLQNRSGGTLGMVRKTLRSWLGSSRPASQLPLFVRELEPVSRDRATVMAAWEKAESCTGLPYPDELMVLRDQREIVFVETSNPISGRKVPWFKDERLQRLGVNLHQQNEPVDPPEQVVYQDSPQVAPTPQKHIFTETMETIQKEVKELFALAKEKIASVKEKISKYQGKRKY